MITGGGGAPRLGAGDEVAGRYTLIWRSAAVERDGLARHKPRRWPRITVKVLHQRLAITRNSSVGLSNSGPRRPESTPASSRFCDLVFDDGVIALVSELIERDLAPGVATRTAPNPGGGRYRKSGRECFGPTPCRRGRPLRCEAGKHPACHDA
jgi:hypothetical protein